MKKILSIVLAVSMLAILFTGCAKEAAPQAPSASSGDSVKKELKIAGMIHVESYIGTMIKQGMQKACDEYGAKLVTTNFNGDLTKETDAANTYAAQGVDGIVCAASQTTRDVYRQAHAQGVQIGVINSINAQDFYATAVFYDQADLGRGTVDYAVKFIKENLNSQPKVHLVRVLAGSFADARGNAFMEGLGKAFGTEYAAPVSQSSTMAVSEALQQVTDALTANPDINVVYCEGEDALLGAYAAIENAGLAGKVFLFGVDGNEQIASYLLDKNNKILQGTAAQDFYTMSYTCTKNLIQVILGEREPSGAKAEFLKPMELNKGDLAAVQKYYDDIKAIS